MPTILDITGSDIETWATSNVQAPSILPVLVRRLLLATANLTEISFRGDGGTRLGDWDGVSYATGIHPFCPEGRTGWEVTTEKHKSKFDGDFQKRALAHSAGTFPSCDAYRAVTARRYRNTGPWAGKKIASGPWSDVKLLDADDLATWIETAPSVHAWFGRVLGKPIDSVSAPNDILSQWSARTSPRLPWRVVVAGEARAKAALLLGDWSKTATSGTLFVQAETREEALLFICASIGEPVANSAAARTLVVEAPMAWRWLSTMKPALPMVLVPCFDEFDVGTTAEIPGVAVVPLGPDSSPPRDRLVALEQIPFGPVSKILQEAGWSSVEADRLARESGAKPAVLQRMCGHLVRPKWLDTIEASEAIPLLLVNSWDPKNPADSQVLATLGLAPAKAEQICVALKRAEGRPVTADQEWYGPRHWRWASEGDAWAVLGGSITDSDLASFRTIARDVLGADDPQYTLPPERRFFASILGKLPPHSPAIRQGLPRSLVRLAIADLVLEPALGPNRGSGLARAIVREILGEAWIRWASLSEVLPLLAEAAPDEFLGALENSMAAGDRGVTHLFGEETPIGDAPHTGLLWALELLAWNPQHASRVALLLSRLTAQDPPDQNKIVNRPAKSLTLILHPLCPQSATSVSDRVSIMQTIAKDQPMVAWKVVMKSVGVGGAFISSIHRPEIVGWPIPPPLARAAPHDAQVQIQAWTEVALDLAKGDIGRLAELITASRHLPADLETKILQTVEDIVPAKTTLDPSGRLWNALRCELSLLHLAGGTAGSPERTSRIRELYDAMTPEDQARQLEWLFNGMPALPDENAGDLARSHERVVELRRDAIERIQQGPEPLDLLARLARMVSEPQSLGLALGNSSWGAELVEQFSDNQGSLPESVIPGLLASVGMSKGRAWLNAVLSCLVDSGAWATACNVLFFLPNDSNTWDLADALGPDVRKAYWTRLAGVFDPTTEECERAISMFLEVGREGIALQTASHADEKIQPQTALRVLEAVLAASDREAVLQSVGHVMFSYHVAKVFKVADATAPEALVPLEIAYFQTLKESECPPRRIFDSLKSQPDLFVRMVCWMHESEEARKEQTETDEPTANDTKRAEACDEILRCWEGYPGDAAEAPERDRLLSDWTRRVLALAVTEGRTRAALQRLAEILVRVPPHEDGAWPCVIARELLANGTHPKLREWIALAEQNRFGNTTRGILDGGAIERERADGYRKWANIVRTSWPTTAALLDDLASRYDKDSALQEAAATADRTRFGN